MRMENLAFELLAMNLAPLVAGAHVLHGLGLFYHIYMLLITQLLLTDFTQMYVATNIVSGGDRTIKLLH